MAQEPWTPSKFARFQVDRYWEAVGIGQSLGLPYLMPTRPPSPRLWIMATIPDLSVDIYKPPEDSPTKHPASFFKRLVFFRSVVQKAYLNEAHSSVMCYVKVQNISSPSEGSLRCPLVYMPPLSRGNHSNRYSFININLFFLNLNFI